MSNERNRLIRPLVYCAILSVATFSGIGIAAITGQLSVGTDNAQLFRHSLHEDRNQGTNNAVQLVAVATPTHVGLTRSALDSAAFDGKKVTLRDGRRIKQIAAAPCKRCGVVQSIERHDLQAPSGRAKIGPFKISLDSTAKDESAERFPVSMLAGSSRLAYSAGPRKYEGATSFIIRLRMEDGSVRTIYEHQLPKFSVGQKVQLINGGVVSLG